MEKKFYTPQEVADLLQLRVQTVYGYVRQGKLSAVRLGNRCRTLPTGASWISSRGTDPSACPASVSGAPAVPKRGGIRVQESATAQEPLSETDRKRLKQTADTLLPARKAESIMEPNGNVKPALSTLTGVC